jgi:hypothetical protein
MLFRGHWCLCLHVKRDVFKHYTLRQSYAFKLPQGLTSLCKFLFTTDSTLLLFMNMLTIKTIRYTNHSATVTHLLEDVCHKPKDTVQKNMFLWEELSIHTLNLQIKVLNIFTPEVRKYWNQMWNRTKRYFLMNIIYSCWFLSFILQELFMSTANTKLGSESHNLFIPFEMATFQEDFP